MRTKHSTKNTHTRTQTHTHTHARQISSKYDDQCLDEYIHQCSESTAKINLTDFRHSILNTPETYIIFVQLEMASHYPLYRIYTFRLVHIQMHCVFPVYSKCHYSSITGILIANRGKKVYPRPIC